MLLEYKEKLPSKLVADLGKLIKQLYNAFNRYDTRKEQLAAIKHGFNLKHKEYQLLIINSGFSNN